MALSFILLTHVLLNLHLWTLGDVIGKIIDIVNIQQYFAA